MFASILILPAGLLVIPGAVLAQSVLEEIVVTARQREESLQDVPATITAFTESDIRRAGIQRAGDFLSMTPGVNLTNAAEVGDTQVSIRGINGARDAETNFAFIVDGILYTNPSAFNREFSDISQIEVLKGPQGAIYGRSASSGAIIVSTRKPGNEIEGLVRARAGFDDHYFGQVAVSGPVAEDELYGRVSVDWRTDDGFYHNRFFGSDIVDDFENFNINGRLIWEPNDRFTADAKLRYGEVDAASITFNAALALPPFTGFFGPNAFEDVNEHDFVFAPNIDPQNDQDTTEFSLKVDYDLDWATVTAWFLYSDINQSFLADGTSGAFAFFFTEPSCAASSAALAGTPVQSPFFVGPTPAFSFYPPYSPTTCDGAQYQERNQEDFSFEVRLTSASDQRLRWLAGFYFLDVEREVGVAQTQDPFGAGQNISSFADPLTEALVHDRFDTTVYSVFGSVNYDVTDDIELDFALRYDREERDVSNLVDGPATRRSTFIDYTNSTFLATNGTPIEDGLAGSPLNPAYVDLDTGAILTSIPNRDEVFEEIEPKVSIRWDVFEEISLFASWGVGFKSGGFNNLGASETVQLFVNPSLLVNDTFKEETSSNFEVGFKSRWHGGRVSIEGAFFHSKVDNMQFFEFFVGPRGLLRVVTNIDEATILGAELGMTALVTDAITVYAAGSLIEGEIDENAHRPITVGNEVPYAPEFTINLGAQMVQPLFDDINFVARLDWRATGDTWFHTVQDDVVPAFLFGGPPADFSLTKRDTFSILDLRMGFEGSNWDVTAFINNATNTNHLEEVIPAPEFGGSFIHPGSHRAWGLEAAYRF